MDVAYQQNFDSLTAGSSVAALSNASLKVLTAGAVSAPNAVGYPAATGDGTIARLTASAYPVATADHLHRYKTRPVAGSNGATCIFQPMLRVSDDGQSWYIPLVSPANVTLYKSVNGVLSPAGDPVNYPAGYPALGSIAVLGFTAEAVGTTIRVRFYDANQAEPTTWAASFTDSSITGPGRPGYYLGTNGGGNTATNASFDDVQVMVPAGSQGAAAPAPAAAPVAPNDPGYRYCGRWGVAATAATTISNGAAVDFFLTGETCNLHFDVSTVVTAGVGNYPMLALWVDGVGPTRVRVPAGGVLPVAFARAAGAHSVRFTANVDSCYTEAGPNNWAAQTQALKFTGADLGGGALIPVALSKPTIEFVGDSITAGLRVLYSGTDGNAADAVESSWAYQVARLLGLDPVVNGHGGQGITTTSTDGTPPVAAAYGFSYAGQPYAPAARPAVVFAYQGTNDAGGFTAGQYQDFLTALRAANPAALIFAAVPYNVTDGRKSAILAAVAAQADPRIFPLDYSAIIAAADTADGIHPHAGGAAKMAARIAGDLQSRMVAAGVRLQLGATLSATDEAALADEPALKALAVAILAAVGSVQATLAAPAVGLTLAQLTTFFQARDAQDVSASIAALVAAFLGGSAGTGTVAGALANLDAKVSTRSTLTGPAGFNTLTIIGGKVAIDAAAVAGAILATPLACRDLTAVPDAEHTVMDALATSHADASGGEVRDTSAMTGQLLTSGGQLLRSFSFSTSATRYVRS